MVTVVDSKDLAEYVTTGVAPVPAEVAADNARLNDEPPAAEKAETTADPEVKAEGETQPDDDTEDENGLTGREKRELTAKMQKAVAKRHRAMKEAEEFAAAQYNERNLAVKRADQLEREINLLKSQLNGDKPVEAAASDGGRPKREAYETDEAYQDAVIDWRAELKVQERDRKAADERAAAETQERLAAAATRVQKAAELVPDFQEKMESADMMVPAHIAGYMQDSELLPELGYHFAEHPDELERLTKMPKRTEADLIRVGLELSKIEGRLKPFSERFGSDERDGSLNGTQPSPTAKPSTETSVSSSKPRAPAPIRPLSSTSGAQAEKDEREMSTREVISEWQRAKQANLGARKRH